MPCPTRLCHSSISEHQKHLFTLSGIFSGFSIFCIYLIRGLHVSATPRNYSGTPLIRASMGQKGFAVLMGWPCERGYFLQENVWWFLPGGQKKLAVITRWLYHRGGRKAGFHCTKFKKLRKVYNLPFFSVLGHFFYPKFPLTSLTKIPSMFLFSASLYLKEIKTKRKCQIFISKY